jgi:hypothetical protein
VNIHGSKGYFWKMIYSVWYCIQNIHVALPCYSFNDSQEKAWEMSQKNIALPDNAHLCVAHLTVTTLTTLGWKILNHPLYSPVWPPAIFTCLNHWRST